MVLRALEGLFFGGRGLGNVVTFRLVRRRFGVGSVRKTDTVVTCVIHRIEALEERVPADEVKPRSTVLTEL